MTDREHALLPEMPPVLADLARQATGIEAECLDCHHSVVLVFERFLDRYGDISLPDFARLLQCSACESRNVHARTVWRSGP